MNEAPWVLLGRGRLRPTRRAWVHIGIGGALYLAGANVAAGWVLLLAGLVLGAVPWAAVHAWRHAGRLEVRRRAAVEVTAEDPVPVGFDLRGAPSAAVVIVDEATGAVGAGTGDHAYSGTARLQRGVLDGGRVEVTVSDPLGLVQATAVGQVPGPLTVVPGTIRLPAWVGDTAHGGDDVAAARSPQGEIIGIRDHVSGDPLRKVHWRSSARRGELVVRETVEGAPEPLDVAIGGGIWDRRALDRAAALACGLAASASAIGRPVALAADGASTPWGPSAPRRLAALPPHAGAEPRPLEDPPLAASARLRLDPGPGGVVAVIAEGAGGASEVGKLPPDEPDPGGWLAGRLRGIR